MERRKFLKSFGTGLAAAGAATLAAPAMADSQPSIRWRMASSFPKSLDTVYGGAEVLAERVKQLTDGKFNIRVFAGGEIVPGLQVLDAVQQGTVECGHSASYYYVGKNKAFAFDYCHTVRFQCPPAERLDVPRWRPATDARILRQIQRLQYSRRQYRHPDGWLVSQGSQDAGRSQGPQDAHPRLRRRSHVAPRRRPANLGGRRCLSLTGDAAPSTPPNGSAPTTTRSWASTRSPSITTIPASGKAAPSSASTSTWPSGTNCPKCYQQAFEVAAAEANINVMAEYDHKNPRPRPPGQERRQTARLPARTS